jgi:hypothetical protein
MRNWLLVGLLAGLALATGCATVTRTSKENLNMYRSIAELDVLEIGDDWNLIWLADHQTRLTKWRTR